MPSQHGCVPAGAHSNDDRRPIDDRGEDERGQVGVVDDVDRNATFARRAGHGRVDFPVARRGDDEFHAIEVGRIEPRGDVLNLAGLRAAGQLVEQLRRHEQQPCAGPKEQLNLARRDVPAADDQGRPAAQLQEYRQMIHAVPAAQAWTAA